FLYELPSAVYWDFCRVMDTLSDLDWTRFASLVLDDQTALRLAEKQAHAPDWVMNRWGSRNGRVRDLLHLLEGLELLRPRDLILNGQSSPPLRTPVTSSLRPDSSPFEGVSCLKPSPPPPPPPRSSPPPPPVFAPPPLVPPSEPPSWLPPTAVNKKLLPRPDPPPFGLQSEIQPPAPPGQPHTQPSIAEASCTSGLMCWSYEEVHAGTKEFSPTLQVGEGGFGVVYKATLRNTVCAVKVLKQDRLLDWKLLKESFRTEMEKLSKFRHPNIIDLLGFSEGPGTVCLIYNYMENKSLEHKLHNGSCLSWSQRVGVVTGASTALQFLHCPPKGNAPLIHGDVKSSNILLDQHMTAKLGDFGLASLCAQKLQSVSDDHARLHHHDQGDAGVPAHGIREEGGAGHRCGRLQLRSGAAGGLDGSPSAGERQNVEREIPGDLEGTSGSSPVDGGRLRASRLDGDGGPRLHVSGQKQEAETSHGREQYSLPLQPSGTSNVSGTGRFLRSESRRQPTAGAAAEVGGVPKSLSPVRSLQSLVPRPSGRSGRQTEARGPHVAHPHESHQAALSAEEDSVRGGTDSDPRAALV
ncbi:unnamed protein product, partial [Tetraodon nigroviridis]